MRPIVLRFVAMAVLFAGWIGYLAYQVYTLPPKEVNGLPTILSRPQFLVSELDVVGVFGASNRELWAQDFMLFETDVAEHAEPVGVAGLVGFAASPLGDAPLAAGAKVAQRRTTIRGVTVTQVLYRNPQVKARLFPDNKPLSPGHILGVHFASPGDFNFGRPLATLPAKPSALGPVLLALTHDPDWLTWDVTPLPPSPGFAESPPRIYPATPETLAEYRQITKP
jgi:hypothetical protein